MYFLFILYTALYICSAFLKEMGKKFCESYDQTVLRFTELFCMDKTTTKILLAKIFVVSGKITVLLCSLLTCISHYIYRGRDDIFSTSHQRFHGRIAVMNLDVPFRLHTNILNIVLNRTTGKSKDRPE